MRNTLVVALLCLCLLMANGEKKGNDCRDDENVLDCIFRMNQVNEEEDSYSNKIRVELLEGDIVATPKLKAQIGEMKAREGAGMSAYDAISNGAWPKATVPYTYAAGFAYKNVVEQAIQEYNAKTCIRFVKYTAARARAAGGYVEFMHGGGCYSMIGRQRGKQQISLGRGCGHKGTAIHEMMHALGFFHEQSRRDRDQHITIYWNNIRKAMWYNFQKYRSGEAATLGEPYDTQSVMHYGKYAFSTNGRQTIVPKKGGSLGNRAGLSTIDVRQLKKYYKCGGTTTKPEKKKCPDSYPFCGDLKNFCTNTWVIANCKKSCNKCTKPTNCTESNKNCKYWANKRYCTGGSWVAWMKTNCKVSCRVC